MSRRDAVRGAAGPSGRPKNHSHSPLIADGISLQCPLRQSWSRLQRSLASPGEQARLPAVPATQLPVRQSWSSRQRAPRSPLSHSPFAAAGSVTQRPAGQSASERHGSMLTEHTKSVVASTEHAAAQSRPVMQRSFMPEMQPIGSGQSHKGCAHCASGQPSAENTKPKRAHESSATGGSASLSVGRTSPSPQLKGAKAQASVSRARARHAPVLRFELRATLADIRAELSSIRQRERADLQFAGALVARDHDAVARGLRAFHLERRRHRARAEQPLAGPDHDREGEHVVRRLASTPRGLAAESGQTPLDHDLKQPIAAHLVPGVQRDAVEPRLDPAQ